MAPDLKELLRDAAARPGEPLDIDDVRRRAAGVARGRRLRAAGAGLAVVALVAVAVVPLVGLVRGPDVEFADTVPPAAEPASEDPGAPPDMWEMLPPAPIRPRVNAASVWTGSEMIVWGGTDPADGFDGLSDGAAYNPVTLQWRTIAPSLLTTTGETTGVWTGSELLVWSGNYQGGDGGAAYDPDADRWRLLPSAPILANNEATAVWTGTEMIVWGGHDPRDASGDGAAYDPRTDTWHRLPPAPIAARFYHQAAWTGEEMIVWGGAAGDGAAGRYYADGAAYNPASDTWRTIAEAPLTAREPGGVLWTGREMLVLGGFTGDNGVPARDGAAYDPRADSWRRLGSELPRGLTSFASAGERVVGWGAASSAAKLYEPVVDAWFGAAAPAGAFGNDAAVAWTGEDLFVYSGEDAAGAAVDGGARLRISLVPTFEGVPPAPTSQEGEAAVPPADEDPPRPSVDTTLPLWPVAEADQRVWDMTDAAAHAFAREVLGWDEPRCLLQPAHDGTGRAECELHGGPQGRWVFAYLAEDDDHGWVVTSVSVPDIGDTSLGVSIRGTRVQVTFDGWNGPPRLDSAELIVQYPDQGAQATASGEPLEFDVDLSVPPEHPGSVLILFRDAQGRVIGAQGTGVPAGDFAAG